MALVDESTREIIKSEADVFGVNATQTAIEQSSLQKHYPLTTVDRAGPLEFKIVSSDDEYIDASTHFLYTKNRILDENGQELEVTVPPAVDGGQPGTNDDAIVFPINYFHATRFKNVEVKINGKSVTSNDNLYPYRAYLETLLNYESNVKKEQLALSFFEKDVADFNQCNADLAREFPRSGSNLGAHARFKRTKNSTTFECIGRIHSEIFSQPKLFINGTTISVKLHPHDQAFNLMAKNPNKRYTISIDTAILFVNHVKISPSVREAHELALLKTNAKYPIREIKMKYFTKSTGRTDLSELNLINGVIPRKIVVGLVSSRAFTGIKSANPFNFHHFNIQNLVLRVNNKAMPFENIEMDFENDNVGQGYFVLLHGTNRLYRNKDADLTLADFKNGNTIFAFDLTPDMSNSHFNLLKEGTVSLEIRLGQPCTESITIVVYSEYDNVISIDKDRNVFID